eukprot:2802831-Amphidinium_carterae.1
MGRHPGSSGTVLVTTTHRVIHCVRVLVFVPACGLVLRVDAKTEGTERKQSSYTVGCAACHCWKSQTAK